MGVLVDFPLSRFQASACVLHTSIYMEQLACDGGSLCTP